MLAGQLFSNDSSAFSSVAAEQPASSLTTIVSEGVLSAGKAHSHPDFLPCSSRTGQNGK